ncbi:PepSY domain-containing protein [Vitreoscilla massiliensis]|uniref:PepSY domain-containing protein n=1 Tax=Vitreoscilla massiliensis TaxID=1689272 RepID=A0ABY4DZR9_9NEIS|nr:PepSY domain-containing protein [Vitreoscilla massiliensis]UOO89032.1 PepSY domain-containing protein [Vitreoscilla massiliensis]
MKFATLICLSSAVLLASNAYAGVHCPRYPAAEQLSVQAMSQKASAAGIQVQQIKIDDGCYEIKGTDKASGKIVKNKYDMKTGKLMGSKSKPAKPQYQPQ